MRRLSATAAVVAMLGAGLALTGCGPDQDEDCAKTYESAALKVEGVTSAEFECGGSFGAETESGTVTLGVDTQSEATPVIEEVYRSFAADPGLTYSKLTGIRFASESGETRFNDDDLGFGGSPSVRQMREKYGITPSPTS
jgi:hypothetical protein